MTKKLLLITLLLLVGLTGLFAESADYFTFTVGAGGGYDMVGDGVISELVYGVDYVFNDMFTGGFKYFDLGTPQVTALNFTVEVIDSLAISIYSGVETTGPGLAYGLGFSYDFLTKKDAVYSSMGLYIDWMAGEDGGPLDVADGGILLIGLRVKFGI